MTTADAWPPPATVSRPWHDRELLVRGAEVGAYVRLTTLRVREVPLWGKFVLLNEAEDAVWCSHCRRLMRVDDPDTLLAHIAPSSGIFKTWMGDAGSRGPQHEQW